MSRVLPAVLTALLTAGVLIAGAPASATPAAGGELAAAAAASTFTPRSPVRVLDTRTGTGGVSGAVPARGTVTMSLAAQVPADATAVVLNVTAAGPSADTYVTVFPAGIARPVTSSLNLPAGDTRANQVTVTLGANRRVSLYNNAGNTHLVADLAGYYRPGAGARFTALPPDRVYDTRQEGWPPGPGSTRVVDLTGSIPESATAVTFNLTVTGSTTGTYVTAWPTGSARPTASNVNLPAGETRPNLVTVAVGPGQQVSFYNYLGSTDFIVDLNGFYTPEYGAAFLPLAPERVLDTRNATGAPGPVGPDETILLDLAGSVPANATGVAMNLTGVNATATTVVTAWAAARSAPIASTLNLVPGRVIPNAAVVAFADARAASIHNSTGWVHLVGDLAGVFVVDDTNPCGSDCVHGWGSNDGWALGNGLIDDSLLPRPVVSLSGARAVTGSGSFDGTGYALLADGTVRAWGSNWSGLLGNGWAADFADGHSAVPVPVVGLTDVTAIEAGNRSAYALRADGTVWSWGYGYDGQLGNGTRTSSAVPVRVTGLTDVTAIGAGDATGYAVRADGTLWAWGDNTDGHLGTGSTADRSTTPVRVTALSNVAAVAGGGNTDGTYALTEDGLVWSWGSNFAGALGTGEYCDPGVDCLSRVPVRVTGLTDVTAVRSGVYNGLALRADGTVWTWGTNSRGALGNGVECEPQDPCSSATPVQVADLDDVTALTAFHGGGLALRADGTVWAWGSNSSGTLGNDTVPVYTTVPVRVQPLSGVTGLGSGVGSGYAVGPTP